MKKIKIELKEIKKNSNDYPVMGQIENILNHHKKTGLYPYGYSR